MTMDELRARLAGLETSLLCDADKELRVMDPGIRPVRPDLKLVGSAFTVTCRDDFLTVLQGLRDSAPGDVLVVDGQGGTCALAGELFATEAARKGLAGIVVDGGVRDVETLRTLPIPVYARHFCPTSGATSRLYECGVPVQCGGVTVSPGDVLFGDPDGILVATASRLAELIPLAEERMALESTALDRMAAGDSLFDMLNLDEHMEKVRAGEPSGLKFTL